MTNTEAITLPWRVEDLPGSQSDSGPTYNGGYFYGGGERSAMSLSVRKWAPMGRPATVELGIGAGKDHGCAVTLDPERARAAAAALVPAADAADAEMAKWREVVERNRDASLEALTRDAERRAGLL